MNTPRNLVVALALISALPMVAVAQPAPAAAPAASAPAGSAPARGSAPGGRGQAPRNAPNTKMGLPPTVAPDAKVEKIATLPTESYTIGSPFVEGATCAPNGDVYFIEQQSDKIMHYSVADKKLSVFMHPSGYSNGMCFDYHGNLISCADEKNELWSISITETESVPYPQPVNPTVGDKPKSGNITLPKHSVLVTGYDGKPLGGPNDVWVRPDGGMYLTDPYYRRPWWTTERNKPETQQVDAAGKPLRTVYFLSPDHKTFKRVLDEFNVVNGRAGTPNGIAGTGDGKTLFVADIDNGQTFKYDIQADGSLKNKTLVCNLGSDGMTLDNQGNLYMSSSGGGGTGVTVVDTKTGKQIGYIPVPEGPANMCFAGKDRSTLYITARTGFYSIETKVKGANPGK